jgi:hypothetical protein
MPTSRTAHTEREREHTCKITSRWSLSNQSSARLTCQGSHKQATPSMQGWDRMSSILCQTYAKSKSFLSSFSSTQAISISYFHDPAIFKSFQTLHPILFIQELQAIKFKQDNSNYITQVEFMSYYMMTATNKRYSYPRVAAIRINIHNAGENPTNTAHAFHAQPVYGPRSYISHAVNA